MELFKYEIKKVIGINCPNKFLLTINNKNICFGNGKNSFNDIISFAYTLDEQTLKNKKIKNRIKEVLRGAK